MQTIDLLDFVLTGSLPPFGRTTMRDDIVRLLGPHDTPHYPDHAPYGNLCFDLNYPDGPLNSVTIEFPHSDHEVQIYDWPIPRWIEKWPDPRIDWSFGPFQPGVSTEEVQSLVTELSEIKPFDYLGKAWGHGHVLEIPQSSVTLHFTATKDSDPRTLMTIQGGFPRHNAG